MPLGGCKRLLVYSFIGLLVYFEGHLYTRVVHILALHLNTNTLHCVFHVSMFSTTTINLFRFHMFIHRLPLSGVSPEALQGTVPLPAPSVRRGTSQAFKLFYKGFYIKGGFTIELAFPFHHFSFNSAPSATALNNSSKLFLLYDKRLTVSLFVKRLPGMRAVRWRWYRHHAPRGHSRRGVRRTARYAQAGTTALSPERPSRSNARTERT